MLLLLLPLLFVLYLVWPFLTLLFRQHVSPLRRLRGPASPSFFMGNLMEMHDQENNNLIARWERDFGSVFTYRGFVGGCRLMITDPVAVAYILANAHETRPGEGAYEKPDFVRDSLATMAAGHEGLLTVEGEQHKRQRKILSLAFTPANMREMTPIFWEKASQLRDVWMSLSSMSATASPPQSPTLTCTTNSLPASAKLDGAFLSKSPNSQEEPYPPSQPFQLPFPLGLRKRKPKNADTLPSSPTLPTPPSSPPPCSQTSRGMRIDVLSYLSRATLDVIGQAGFGYTFDSLPSPSNLTSTGRSWGEEENELAKAFSVIFSTARKFRAITILQVWFPFLRRFRRNSATMVAARETMRRIGLQLIKDCTASLSSEKSSSTYARDLLSILIRSNVAETPSHQMSEDEILCQISTFIAAGHETTSNALTWTLFALCQVPDKQARLRQELRGIQKEFEASLSEPIPGSPEERRRRILEDPSLRSAFEVAISKAPYLDAVVRESLRIHAPVTSTMRVCLREGGDEIPVGGSFCNEKGSRDGGYLDKDGVLRHSIKVNKWDIITIPIQAVNKSVALWGEDAAAFRPERWEELPPASRAINGIYSNVLSFLGGSRSCIGYKLALTEMKIFMYILLKDMEYSMDPGMVIEKKVNVVTRPWVKSEPNLGNQMPLYMRPVNAYE